MPSYTWKPLRIGAGGWLTGIDIAPDSTMVVHTDTYGAYLWNGLQWQQLVTSTSMPAADVSMGHSGGVYEIRIAPSDANVLYMEDLGCVYRSGDKGATWTKPAFSPVVADANDPYRMNGQKLAVDPNNPDVVYVGTPQSGLFVTTDGGASWQSVSGVPVSAQDGSGLFPGITGIVFDSTSGTGVPSLGTNLDGAAYWTTGFPYIDLMHQASEWLPQSSSQWNTGVTLDLDSSGWVTSLPAGRGP